MTRAPKQTHAQRATSYARNVCNGSIVACKWVRLACQRHLNDLDKQIDSRWKYNEAKVNAVCAIAESLRHEKGQLQGQRFNLQDWQVFVLASIFGWMDENGIRKYREAFILVPRGNGKSPLAAIIGILFAFFEQEPGAEVYCGATTEKQALEVFRPAKAFVEQEPALQKMGITPAAKSIFQQKTRSRFLPVIGKAKYGGSVYLAILDEAHQLPDSQLYDALKTGTNKRRNSLFLTISTAGVQSAENPCYQKQQDVEKILEGTIEDERVFGIIYTVDVEIPWTSRDAVRMANPNLGISNDEEAIFLDHDEAIRNSAKQNIFRTMHLNEWMTASSAWMNMQSWAKCYDHSLTEESVKGLPCIHGSDLASKLDLAATVTLFRDDSKGDKPHFYCFCRAYLPESRVNAPENQHYQKWSKQGFLTATHGSSIDYALIERDTFADIAKFDVQELAYDERYADQFSQRVSEESGIPRVVIKPNPAELSPSMKELEAAVADGRFHHTNHPVLNWCMSNVLTYETAAGNYAMPDKAKPESKIDAAMALFIAMRRAMVAEPVKASFAPFFI